MSAKNVLNCNYDKTTLGYFNADLITFVWRHYVRDYELEPTEISFRTSIECRFQTITKTNRVRYIWKKRYKDQAILQRFFFHSDLIRFLGIIYKKDNGTSLGVSTFTSISDSDEDLARNKVVECNTKINSVLNTDIHLLLESKMDGWINKCRAKALLTRLNYLLFNFIDLGLERVYHTRQLARGVIDYDHSSFKLYF